MAKFCSNCGRPLEEGEVCNCTEQTADVQQEENQVQKEAKQQQEESQEQQETKQQQENNQDQQENAQSQSTGEGTDTQTANKVVEELKEGLLSLIPVVKKPVTEGKKLAEKNNIKIGLEFISIKAIVTLIIVLIALQDAFSYISAGSVILSALLLTIGTDCLEAILLKSISGVFKVKAETNSMFTIVGIRAAYETAVILVVAILSIISGSFAVMIYAAASAAIPALQYGLYSVTVEGDTDKKIYGYMLVKVIMAVVIALITYLFAQSIVGGVMGSILGGAGSFGF